MSINTKELGLAVDGQFVHVCITGRLSREDYEVFAPQVERLMENYEGLNLLVELLDFEGWTAGALWEDTKFAAAHFSDFQRVGIVGDSQWEKGMAYFCKPFTGAQVKYFNTSQRVEAEAWVRRGEP